MSIPFIIMTKVHHLTEYLKTLRNSAISRIEKVGRITYGRRTGRYQ